MFERFLLSFVGQCPKPPRLRWTTAAPTVVQKLEEQEELCYLTHLVLPTLIRCISHVAYSYRTLPLWRTTAGLPCVGEQAAGVALIVGALRECIRCLGPRPVNCPSVTVQTNGLLCLR